MAYKSIHRLKLLFLALFITSVTASIAAGQWRLQKIATQASFRGLSVVNNKVIWASGTNGTVVRTVDGGKTWQIIIVPGAEKLDFRDVEAFDANLAYILSIGPGESSRIYQTTDGGQTWALQFQNTDQNAFFDALAFWDKEQGLAMSDPVSGRFLLLSTIDGGKHWTPVNSANIPPAIAGEGGFAASGTCLITRGKRDALLVSGGAVARVYHSGDKGQTWNVQETQLQKGTAGAGIFSIAFTTAKKGIIVGGDYTKPDISENTAAFTEDGGNSWTLANKFPNGFRSGVAFSRKHKYAAAVGTSGTDLTRDGGRTWQTIDAEDFNAVAAAPDGSFWAAGPRGRLGRLQPFN